MGCNLLTGPAASASGSAQSTFGAVVGPQDATTSLVTEAAPNVSTQAVTAAPTAGKRTKAPPKPTEQVPVLTRSMMGIQAYGYSDHTTWGQLMDRALHMGFRWMKFQ